MIDLHVHSTFSDGSDTPEELVRIATEGGLSALSLTDHDTTAGLARFAAACDEFALRGIPGVEVSAELSPGTLHMLGYFIVAGHEQLEDTLRRVRAGRSKRNDGIFRKLEELGFPLTREEVEAYAGDEVVGRPHFAQAMLARGYASSKEEVFEKYLAKGKPAYVDRWRPQPEESIAVIRAAGGVPVLGHPFTLRMSSNALRAFVRTLADAGLGGIEVYYPEHRPAQVREYLQLAKHFDLVPTGGSDYHGNITPDIRLGRGFGSLDVPEDAVTELQNRTPQSRETE